MFLDPRARAFLKQHIVGGPQSVFYISYWSIMHMISGVVFVLLFGPHFAAGFVVHTCWEAWQIYIQMTPTHTTRGRIDIIVDTAMFMFGMWISSRIVNELSA